VALWNPEWGHQEWSPTNISKFRKFIDINLNGTDQNDKTKLEFAQLKIREINATNDTIRGVHFSFGDSTKFWVLFHSLEILKTERAERFIMNADNIWFFYASPEYFSYKPK